MPPPPLSVNGVRPKMEERRAPHGPVGKGTVPECAPLSQPGSFTALKHYCEELFDLVCCDVKPNWLIWNVKPLDVSL